MFTKEAKKQLFQGIHDPVMSKRDVQVGHNNTVFRHFIVHRKAV